MPDINFSFNPRTQRYQYTSGEKRGRFLGKNQVRDITRGYIEGRKQETRDINQDLFNNNITVGEWEKKQAKLIKDLTLETYKIGKPNLGRDVGIDRSDYGKIGKNLQNEYLHLRNFARQIIQGNLTQSQIDARAEMYIDKTMWGYHEGSRSSHKEAGWKWERRQLSPVEHCSSCPTYAAQGWVTIGTLPAITTRCECRARDKCWFEYSSSRLLPKESSKNIIQYINNSWLFH